MQQQLELLTEPRVRHTDPDTSRDAAATVKPGHNRRLEAIAQLVEASRDDGMTADEVHSFMSRAMRSTIHGAVSACCKAGLIVPTARTRPSVSGCAMRVYIHPRYEGESNA